MLFLFYKSVREKVGEPLVKIEDFDHPLSPKADTTAASPQL